ncbi:hydrolase, carbon-nitrogen family [Shigella flexneri 2a]|nr:hydrolase, carbon-nitrogen family [Shigella flexneri 2a]
MSFWKVAAAQYEPRKTSLTEQVAHHLEFVRAAARQQCQLLVFPSLSLLGCDYSRRALPAPTRSFTVRPALLCRNDLANDHHCRPSR